MRLQNSLPLSVRTYLERSGLVSGDFAQDRAHRGRDDVHGCLAKEGYENPSGCVIDSDEDAGESGAGTGSDCTRDVEVEAVANGSCTYVGFFGS